jgi:hypothetical protein
MKLCPQEHLHMSEFRLHRVSLAKEVATTVVVEEREGHATATLIAADQRSAESLVVTHHNSSLSRSLTLLLRHAVAPEPCHCPLPGCALGLGS